MKGQSSSIYIVYVFSSILKMKNALITGITGQDGSYLAELLLEKGYNVYGLMRRKSVVDYGNVDHIKDKIKFIYADMQDIVSLITAMKISQADEVYNLAAHLLQHHGIHHVQQQILTQLVLQICLKL